MIKSIPTVYAEIQFRSRLEAKWAMFFDQLVDFRWEYEPFDFDGWIPDFYCQSQGREWLCEVKPITDFDENIANEILEATQNTKWQEHLTLHGSMLLKSLDSDEIVMGWVHLPNWKEKAGLDLDLPGGWVRMRTEKNRLWRKWTKAINGSQWKSPRHW